MAACAGCAQPISYGRYWVSFFTNFFRNAFTRSKMSPIITCGHCGQDNVQLLPYVLLQLVALVALVAAVFWLVKPQPTDSRTKYVVLGLGVYLPFEFVWWTFVTRLKRLGE